MYLFITGLPLSLTKDDLEKLFGQYGALKDIRLVTYRNGHFKGLAYVDFADEVRPPLFHFIYCKILVSPLILFFQNLFM